MDQDRLMFGSHEPFFLSVFYFGHQVDSILDDIDFVVVYSFEFGLLYFLRICHVFSDVGLPC